MTDETSRLRESLLQKMNPNRVPVHIGIIMDGNGRWAKSRGLSRLKGHQQGARRVQGIVRFADGLGVKHLSLYAFSVENWTRPGFEVSALMRLIRAYIIRERNALHSENVRFNLVGRKSDLNASIIEQARISTELMASNTGLSLNLCINYGGRAEIVDAMKAMIGSGIMPEQITEESVRKYLYFPAMPDVDLVIRTSGEMRMSNFLLWESAYAEFYVTQAMWPDFDEIELLRAIIDYQGRERRFGKIGEQLSRGR